MAKDFIARCIAASNEGGGGGESYVLPKATATRLGGIKVGDGLNIDGNGVLSAEGGAAYELPPATANELGGVKVGSGLNVAADGTLSNGYELPTAAAGTLGGVKVGNGLRIDGNGVLSATGGGSAYVLPPATANELGGVKVGTGLNVAADGTLSNGITLPQDLSARLEALETQCVGQTGLTQAGRLNLRLMTKAQYEALPSHDNDTLYITQDNDANIYAYVGDTLLNNGGGWLGSVVVVNVAAIVSILIYNALPCSVVCATESSEPITVT